MRSARKLVAALALAALMAALSTALVVPAALGWAANNTCDSVNFICVSRDDGNGVPRAVAGSDDSSYVGDYYYNTTDKINDTVSSVKNRSLTQDLYFWEDVGYNGNSHYCLDSDWYNANLGSFSIWPDDHFSSHQQVGNSC
jgi:hypothetical protein